MNEISGIHHVTCISGNAQENLDFYTGVLGMRMVKKSVNQDVPDTYHLFFADAEGHPGADITFFPWPQMPPATPGIGLSMEVSLAVPSGSLAYWTPRLLDAGIRVGAEEQRFGERALPLTDPHGLSLTLVETTDSRQFTPWNDSPVPSDRQVLGLHSVRLWEHSLAHTVAFLVGTLGFRAAGQEGMWHRYAVGSGGSGCHLDLREIPNEKRGRWGVGGVHHVAWRVADEGAQRAVQQRVAAA
ncbi:MAG TPA: VOC family protein, partial [Gemmatimonadaceae bacterium]|nr:VOC family protein [Gemmatimonadaceae bacterium]